MELLEALKNLTPEEKVVVSVNDEIRDTMALFLFQENSLQLTLEAVRENRYGFYDRDSVIDILAQIEDKRVERINFINGVAQELLGENYRQIMDELGVEFQIDSSLPVIVFFRVN